MKEEDLMRYRAVLLFASIVLITMSFFAGCETLKSSKPIMPIKEYEKMIVGRFDANYIGTENCLRACHAHDKIKQNFEASTMGAQMSSKSGMPVVDCESCHGPGSLAVEGITEEKVAEDEKAGKHTACKFDTLINLKTLPSPAQSLICLKCHSANATFNLHNWNTGAHSSADVSCSDCHKIHAGPDLIVRAKEVNEMCFRCHAQTKAEFTLPSHHAVLEKKVICTDCHDPHGSIGEGLLRRESVKETCAQCHTDKQGPFAFEHGDIMEECSSCHNPHGSVNNNMLKTSEPFLCLQCHEGHWLRQASGASVSKETKATYYTMCTDCHSTIHGTDLPSPSGKGRFVK